MSHKEAYLKRHFSAANQSSHKLSESRKRRKRYEKNKMNMQPNSHNNQNNQLKEDENFSKNQDKGITTLHWNCKFQEVTVNVEEEVAKVLIKWPKSERGMMKNQPKWRVQQIRKRCKNNISFLQACSLRRLCLKLQNPHKTMGQLGLGSFADIRQAAALFEEAVEKYLVSQKVKFRTQEEQIELYPSNTPLPPTPDFLLRTPIRLHKYYEENNSERKSGGANVEEFQTIHWIEAKMFYGASIIPQGTDSAVGSLMKTAKKYVEAYGSGAMVFMYGCGEGLSRQLSNETGIIVLDASPLNLKKVREQQKTWCADEHGKIMP